VTLEVNVFMFGCVALFATVIAVAPLPVASPESVIA
jgi:hypothetical protein